MRRGIGGGFAVIDGTVTTYSRSSWLDFLAEAKKHLRQPMAVGKPTRRVGHSRRCPSERRGRTRRISGRGGEPSCCSSWPWRARFRPLLFGA